jgi:hypothetical protein
MTSARARRLQVDISAIVMEGRSLLPHEREQVRYALESALGGWPAADEAFPFEDRRDDGRPQGVQVDWAPTDGLGALGEGLGDVIKRSAAR